MAEPATVEQGSTEFPALHQANLITHNLFMPGTADTRQRYRKIWAEGRESLPWSCTYPDEQLWWLQVNSVWWAGKYRRQHYPNIVFVIFWVALACFQLSNVSTWISSSLRRLEFLFSNHGEDIIDTVVICAHFSGLSTAELYLNIS